MIYLHTYRRKPCFGMLGKPSQADILQGLALFLPTGPRSRFFKTLWLGLAHLRLFRVKERLAPEVEERLARVEDALKGWGKKILFFFPLDPLSRRLYAIQQTSEGPLFWKAAFDEENGKRLKKEYAVLSRPSLAEVKKPVPVALIEADGLCLTGYRKEEIRTNQELTQEQEEKLFALLKKMETSSVARKRKEDCSWWAPAWAQIFPLEEPIKIAFAHGDMAPQNIGFSGGEIFLTDWENCFDDAPFGADRVRYLAHGARARRRGRPSCAVIEMLRRKTGLSLAEIRTVTLFLLSLDSKEKADQLGTYLRACLEGVGP